MEVWKPVKNYEDFYQVSNLGIIKILERKVTIQRGIRAGISRIIPERIMSLQKGKSGYLRVGLVDENGKYGYFRVNRLVAQAFLDFDIKSDLVVMHLDNNRTNNNLNNLRIGTQKENVKQRDREGRKASTKGTLNPMSTIKESEVLLLREEFRNGKSVSELALVNNRNYTQVYKIVKNIRWKHI